MVYRSKERCRCQIDQVVVWIELERNVVRNPKHSVPPADHSLLVPAIGKSNAGRELLLIQGYVAPSVVRGRQDERRVTDTWRIGGTVATCDRGISDGWIKVAQTVVTVGPWSLKFVAESRVQSPFLIDMPGITCIKRTVGLTASGLGWNLRRAFCLVHEGSRAQLAQAKQEISEREAAVCRGIERIVRRPGSREPKRSAGNVGLVVIVQPQLILRAKLQG